MKIDGIKKLGEMRGKVREDLEHIPRGHFEQNMLREYYWVERMNSLGKKSENPNASREDILEKAIENIKRDNPHFDPEFDRGYFKI